MKTTLLQMKPGDDGQVVQVDADEAGIQQLYQVGVVPGIQIQMLAQHPLQGPVVVKIGNQRLAIERQLAALVEVERA